MSETRWRVRTPWPGELRYGLELSRLLTDARFRAPTRADGRRPVLLIPGFMTGDASLAILADWLRRRGHQVRMSGIRLNVDCSGRLVRRLEALLDELDGPAVLIGQSRGGYLARALAARRPDAIAALAMLGSPVLDPLAVSGPMMWTVRGLAQLGDRGLPGLFSSSCVDGDCCADFRELLHAPLPTGMAALALHSRSDGIVDWRACLDPCAECVEVGGSHLGMAVNPNVYREIERLLELAGGER